MLSKSISLKEPMSKWTKESKLYIPLPFPKDIQYGLLLTLIKELGSYTITKQAACGESKDPPVIRPCVSREPILCRKADILSSLVLTLTWQFF